MANKHDYRIQQDNWKIANTLALADQNGDKKLVEWCERELERRKTIK